MTTATQMTEAQARQLELYREWIEHAPKDPGKMASDIVGWVDGLGIVLCPLCAGRIMARGCQLEKPCTPQWEDQNPTGDCDLCGMGS